MRRSAGPEARQGGRLSRKVLAYNCGRVARKWRAATQHLEECAAKRVKVRRWRGRLSTQHLRGHVDQRTGGSVEATRMARRAASRDAEVTQTSSTLIVKPNV